MKKLLLVVPLLALSVAYILWPRGVAAELSYVTYGDYSQSVEFDGTLRYDWVDSVKAHTDGTLDYVAQLGCRLKEGDVAYSVDDGLRDAIELTERELREVTARLTEEAVPVWGASNDAETILNDLLACAGAGSVAYRDFNDAVEGSWLTRAVSAQSDQSVLEASRDRLQAQLTAMKESLPKLEAASGLEGQVIYAAKEGQLIMAGETVLEVGSGDLIISCPLDAESLCLVDNGMSAQITSGGRVWTGTVTSKAPYLAEITPPMNFVGEIGQSVSVRVNYVDVKNGVIAPLDCVGRDETGSYVMAEKDGRLHRQDIAVAYTDQNRAIVAEGLGVGQAIAKQPEKYTDGQLLA